MRLYKIAATLRSGRYIENKLSAQNIDAAFCSFIGWLSVNHRADMESISELDITETGESE